MFNPENLKQYTTSSQGSTRVIVVPAKEYTGIIGDDLNFRQSPGTKDPSKIYTFMDVSIIIDSAEAREVTKREKPSVRFSCGVDLTPDGLGFDMSEGKNVHLNRLRDAVGQNIAGQGWAPSMLVGKPLKVKVSHRPNPNSTDPLDVYAEVAAVSKL